MIGHCGGLRPTPEDRRLRARPRLSARRSRARSGAAARNPAARHRRGPAGARTARPRRQRRARRGPQAADAHRHRRHHRRPQLGAALHPFRAPPVSSAARSAIDMESATIAGAGLSLPRALRHAAVRLATSRSTARSSCRARPTGSTRRRSPRTCRSASRLRLLRAEGAALHRASCARSTSRRSGRAASNRAASACRARLSPIPAPERRPRDER